MGKRILICGAQVPFVRGGAEYLVAGLHAALREHGHTVDVVSLPFTWRPVAQLVQSALAWRLLDLTHVDGQPVDQLICTKFPSYMAQHPRKVVWLVHQYRQAYDLYGTPMSEFSFDPAERDVQRTVYRMDAQGLGEATARYTISRNVSARLHRYNNLASTPLYPPSPYSGRLYAGEYGDYVLACSRLDAAKRLDLLIRAVAQSDPAVRVVIAGTGDERANLARLAAQLGVSNRVQLCGFVDDDTLLALYAGARAVYYAPLDEDYGFSTIEACAAARPVITTTDAGGVLEFVTHGVNGLVVPPDPAAIAGALTRLTHDAPLAATLGQAGTARVAGISWQQVVQSLVL